MSVRIDRIVFHLVGTALVGFASAAMPDVSAQVILNLTTTMNPAPNNNCQVSITDPQGIHLDPGGTDLIASGATLTGAGCGIAGNSTTPPQLSSFSATPSSGTLGASFGLAWTVTGNPVPSCTGTVTVDGNATQVAGWSGVANIQSPTTVTPSAAGTYAFTLTCANSAGSAHSTASVLVQPVSGGGDNCGQQPTANVCFQGGVTPTSCAVFDATKFENLFGRASPTATPTLFPGLNGIAIAIKDMSKTGFISAKFTVPVGINPQLYGTFQRGENYNPSLVTMSISPTCGFATNPPNPDVCLINQISGGPHIGGWTTNGFGANCPLTPGNSYFLNIKFTTPPTNNTSCSGSTCILQLEPFVTLE